MDQAGPPSCLELSRVPSVLASVSSGSSNYTATRATTSEFRDEPQVGRTRIVPYLSIEQRKCPILDRRSQRNDALACLRSASSRQSGHLSCCGSNTGAHANKPGHPAGESPLGNETANLDRDLRCG